MSFRPPNVLGLDSCAKLVEVHVNWLGIQR